MKVVDFLNIREQQKFEEEKSLNPIEIRIENNRVQNMLERYKKNMASFRLEGVLFSSRTRNKKDEIFLVARRIADAKYSLINNSLYQMIGVVNLKKIEKWDEIKTSSRWVKVSFQSHEENRQVRHFSYNLLAKNKNNLLNFMLKLIDSNKKDNEFINGGKKFPIINFLIEFLI